MRESETDEYERVERLREHSDEGLALAMSTLSNDNEHEHDGSE